MNKKAYIKIWITICFAICTSDWAIHSQTNKTNTDPFFRHIYTQTEIPDYTFGEGIYAGWYFPIQLTSSIYQGFGFSVEFSTGNAPINRSIFIIGTEYQSSIDYCLDFKENNSYITVSRHVKQGDKAGFYNTDSWNKQLLERNTNYVLNVEIDETRFRYSIYEKGFEKDIKYEYEFYGLASSYFRNELTKNRLSVAVNLKDYAVQSLTVYDLGFGVGVNPIIPENIGTRYAYIINNNSNLYLRRDGSTGTNDYTKQAQYSGSANDIWKITPMRQSSRNIDTYPVSIHNMYKNTFIAPLNCSIQSDAYICETPLDNCSSWKIIKEDDNNWNIRNATTNGYLSIRYDSKSTGEYGIQKMNSIPTSGKWRFENVNIYPSLTTGYYIIKVSASNKFMSVLNKSTQDGAYIVQHSNDHSDSKVWYIEEQPEGTYTIKNADTNQYLAIENDAFSPNAYLVQRSTFHNYASEKWIIDREDFYYTIKNFASGKPICIRYDYLSEDEYFIQTNEDSHASTRLFEIDPIYYDVDNPLGGMYKLRNTYTGLYLAVESQSTQAGAYLRASLTADTNTSWWTIEKQAGGSSIIRNVKSNMCVTVQNRNGSAGAYLVQEPINGLNGSSFWHFHKSEVVPSNIFFINNVFSGMTFVPQDLETSASTYIVQRYSGTQDRRMRWELIPVSQNTTSEISKQKTIQHTDDNILQNKIHFTQLENDIWKIYSTEQIIKNIIIVAMNGKIVRTTDLSNNISQIDLSSLAHGVYIVKVTLENGDIETKKISL